MKKVFFLGYGGGHINTLIPVIQQLMKTDQYDICTIGINLAAQTLRSNGIPCKTLSDYMTDEILEIGRPLALQYHNFASNVSYADSIAYYGFSMRDLIKSVGNEMAEKIFEIYDRRLYLPIDSMREILEKEKPDVVVVTTMHRFEAATILAAKELQIPSIKIEDLVGNIQMPFPDKIQVNDEAELENFIRKGFKRNQLVLKSDLNKPEIAEYRENIYKTYMNMKPNKVCVISDFVKQKLVERGMLDNQVIITGQPAFDKLIKFKEIDKSFYLHELGLDSNKFILSFMSQPLPNREEYLRKIIEGIRNIKNLQFVIKLHPNEDGSVQKMILDELNYNAVLVKDISAPIITQISDITSTISSTTGLEAASLGKDLIYFNFSKDKEFVPYEDMGIGIKVTDNRKLSNLIKDILEKKDIQMKMKESRMEYMNIGCAAENVKNVIDDVLGDDV